MKERGLLFLVLILLPLFGFAQWKDCPSGTVNDPYPGQCGSYVDTDDDGICDHSQASPQRRNEGSNFSKKRSGSKGYYHLFEISLPLVLLYVITSLFSKHGVLKLASNRKFWNFLLLLTFLASVSLGMVKIVEKSFDVSISLPFRIIYWHAEIGIAMATLTCLHIFWHWRYFIPIRKIK